MVLPLEEKETSAFFRTSWLSGLIRLADGSDKANFTPLITALPLLILCKFSIVVLEKNVEISSPAISCR
ncbi:hypothetical protein D3C76_1586070 [compost metagenome]